MVKDCRQEVIKKATSTDNLYTRDNKKKNRIFKNGF